LSHIVNDINTHWSGLTGKPALVIALLVFIPHLFRSCATCLVLHIIRNATHDVFLGI